MSAASPRRIQRTAAGLLAVVLVAGACTGSDDDAASDGFDVELEEGEVEQPVEFTDDELDQFEDSLDQLGDEDSDEEDPVDPSTLSVEELATYVDGLTDKEFEDFANELSDEDYDALVQLLEGADTPEPPSDEDQDEQEPDPTGEDSLTSERGDVDCSTEGLGADDSFEFTAAHFVVDGQLGAACFRESDDRLTQAWGALATIAPAGQLADLGLFGGFESSEDTDEITLAFVNTLDDDGTLFQMSVNLDAFADDPDEAQVTMAHEFAHVFTQIPSQMDRTDEAIDNCATYFNGDGCLYENSILWQWIELFWGANLIADVDPTAENSSADGEQRCNDDAGFFGSYGASTPDEDFAESFSAYVFDTGVTSDERRERIDWIAAQPGLSEFRNRAVAAGLTGLANNFESCGR